MAIEAIYEGLKMTAKRCGRCKETKPASEFNKMRSAASGLQSYCRPCNLAKNKEFQAKHPLTRRGVSIKDTHKVRHINRSVARSKASFAVADAVSKGEIPRAEKCEYCDMTDKKVLHAHHYKSYAPVDHLKIHWVCPPCHAAWHEDHGPVPHDLDWDKKVGDP